MNHARRIYRLATVKTLLAPLSANGETISTRTIYRWEDRELIPRRMRIPGTNSVYWDADEFDAALERIVKLDGTLNVLRTIYQRGSNARMSS
jgi:predicted DNA-binding transcriptional regulator AlpA